MLMQRRGGTTKTSRGPNDPLGPGNMSWEILRFCIPLSAPLRLCVSFHYSGSGLPFVSGKNGRTNSPIKNTPHIVMPA
jgi:hypothetical protein